MRESDSNEPVVDIHGVTVIEGKDAFDLALRPGELAVIEARSFTGVRRIANHATGMLRDESGGHVSFLGRRWDQMSKGEMERNRRRVGRVFSAREGAAWVQNLDIDENIQLGQQFDLRRSTREIKARAEKWGRRFHLDELPTTRPARTSPRTKMLSQWTRAFLPDPLSLLILETPVESVGDDEKNTLLDAISEARSAGVAVLWLDFENSEPLKLEPDFQIAESFDGFSLKSVK